MRRKRRWWGEVHGKQLGHKDGPVQKIREAKLALWLNGRVRQAQIRNAALNLTFKAKQKINGDFIPLSWPLGK